MRLPRGGDHSTSAFMHDLHVPRAPAFFYDPRRGCAPGKVHPDLFFEDGYEPIAQQICMECPFRRACDKWATERHEVWGMWGARRRQPRRTARRLTDGEIA